MSALPDQLPRSRSAPTGTGRGGELPYTVISTPLLQVAGKLGLGGVLIGLFLLILDCAGLDAAMEFGPAVVALGAACLVLTAVAAGKSPDAWVLAIVGGGLELAVWLRWSVLF